MPCTPGRSSWPRWWSWPRAADSRSPARAWARSTATTAASTTINHGHGERNVIFLARAPPAAQRGAVTLDGSDTVRVLGPPGLKQAVRAAVERS